MMNLARKVLRRGRDLLPTAGFHFDQPLVLLQSDDWGRVGLRDHEGLEQLRAAGVRLGEHPYDFHTLETAEDLGAAIEMLKRHRDYRGRYPCLGMNFVLANLDFEKMRTDAFRQIHILPLADGLPRGWNRPGLMAAYRAGIAEGIFHPALHGATHFCQTAVERSLNRDEDRAVLLRTFWQAGTPYIHWRMPWIGYEYWDEEKPEDQRFLSADMQRELIGKSVGAFAKLFGALPRSACAPGYRGNEDTHRAWAQHGIRVAQNGPGLFAPPHFDRQGLFNVSRSIELEPAVDPNFSLDACMSAAESRFQRGFPAIISVHSINFHSTLRDFRSSTLRFLDDFLTALEARHPDLLYLCDEDLRDLVEKGSYLGPQGAVQVNAVRRNFTFAEVARQEKARA